MLKVTGQLRFFGIGTLLDGRHDQSVRKVVLGAGLGEKGAAFPDASWEFHWVRGPLTAQKFGLPANLAVGDPALLWPELQATTVKNQAGPIGLIPHYQTWDSFDWPAVAARAGMIAINPRQSPQAVLAQMRSCSRILTESLHGAICADAMGIEWAPCVLAQLTRFKLKDRRPALRPVAAASAHDIAQVASALASYGTCATNFKCSPPARLEWQRQRMLGICRNFAARYQLRFTP